MADFAVRIKNLPDESAYDKSTEQLAAQLEQHLGHVVEEESQVIRKAGREGQVDIKPSEIASINFA